MRKWLLLCFTALLASCIPVDDIGEYWEKGVIDPALLGNWQPMKGSAKDVLIIADKGKIYQVDGIDRDSKDYKPSFGRTLNVGRYTFFMSEPKGNNSVLVRYKVTGNTLENYSLDDKAMYELLVDKYRSVLNMTVNSGSISPVTIKKLDEKVFNLLSEIPDTGTYWKRDSQFKRSPQ